MSSSSHKITGPTRLHNSFRVLGVSVGRFAYLCVLSAFCVSVVNVARPMVNTEDTETQRAKRTSRKFAQLSVSLQGPGRDYSTFKHSTDRHASQPCTACHQRGDNSATPRFPGHKACTSCHLGQFVTPDVPMCAICHADVNSSNPPLKAFPARFNETFNMKFDHAQHMTGSARPANGCSACHGRVRSRPAALSIPAGLAAHNQCYSCHTPSSKNNSGGEMASCGVCHDQRGYSRTSTNARAFRYAFSHVKHAGPQRLGCADCHSVTAGAPQSRQVSSPATVEHFPTSRGKSCATCHNGGRAFGGDLAFKDCRRCHTGKTFRMPM